MKLSDLDWGEAETGGLLNATWSVAEARFAHRGRPCVAVEWYRRTGHPFHPYASLVLIAGECDRTADGALLRQIAFGSVAGAGEGAGAARVLQSAVLGRKIVLIEDPASREMELDAALDAIL